MTGYSLIAGDSVGLLCQFQPDHFDAVITDPPYGLRMADWDGDVPPVNAWYEVFRVMKPGAFVASFCSPRLYHRMADRMESAGLEIVDQVVWINAHKKPVNGRLKQMHEPIAIARKPGGTATVNVDAGRWHGSVPLVPQVAGYSPRFGRDGATRGGTAENGILEPHPGGRWPGNVIGDVEGPGAPYFYAPRVTKAERERDGNIHPTPKPVAVMEWMVKLFSPPGGIILDPFCGSGTTGVAALANGRQFVGLDMDAAYLEIADRRLQKAA